MSIPILVIGGTSGGVGKTTQTNHFKRLSVRRSRFVTGRREHSIGWEGWGKTSDRLKQAKGVCCKVEEIRVMIRAT